MAYMQRLENIFGFEMTNIKMIKGYKDTFILYYSHFSLIKWFTVTLIHNRFLTSLKKF